MALSGVLAACGSMSSTTPRVTPTPRTSASPSATPKPTPAPQVANPAPVIVQVENSQAARPQSGLSFASMVYEYVAEGGVGRFSAVFNYPPNVTIGPVRSARLATLHLLRLYQGLLLYSGADQYIQGLLASSGDPHFDENSAGGTLFRTGNRFPPHNLYTDGSHITSLVDRVKPGQISYATPESVLPVSAGPPVAHFRVPISFGETPEWTWTAAAGGWLRSEADTGPSIDADTGHQVLATTVVVQQVQITVAPQVVDVNGVHGVDHMLSGSGTAQVFVGGMEYDASWSQGASGPPQLTLPSGKPAPIAPGLIWFELVATGSPATIG